MTCERFTLRLAEVETGIVLDSRGERCLGTSSFRPTFATQEAALEAKDLLLQRFPFAEVWLLDGAAEHEPERFVDEVRFKIFFHALTHGAGGGRRLGSCDGSRVNHQIREAIRSRPSIVTLTCCLSVDR